MVTEGDPADDLFIIRVGEFVVTKGGRHLNVLGPGEWFGEIGLMQRRPRVATVAARSRARPSPVIARSDSSVAGR